MIQPAVIKLEWLGDPKDKPPPLLNAENLAVTADGRRLFVTGTERVCEIVAIEKDGYAWTDVPLPDGLPKDVFRNGIAADGRYLYLACAHIDQHAHPLLGGWFPPLTQTPQDTFGATMLFLAEALCEVRSYVLRADLSARPLRFSESVELTGKCFANGLAVDGRGAVYAANSLLGANGGIHRLTENEWHSPSRSETTLWHKTAPLHFPNGIKITGDTLYFTQISLLPILSSTIEAVSLFDDERKIPDEPKIPRESLCRSSGVLFDDLAVVDDGFVVAAITDFTNVSGAFGPAGYGAGAIRLFGADGTHRSEIRDPQIKHPSAVAVLQGGSSFGQAGDLLVTEKESHTVWRLRIDGSGIPLWGH